MRDKTNPHVKGTILPPRRLTKINDEDRECTVCSKAISGYNDNDTCWEHTEKKPQRISDREIEKHW